MRLTKKDVAYITSGANVIQIPDIVEGHKYTGQAIIKLGQLEDIEDELGIDLVTLFKALKNGVYYITKTQGLRKEYIVLTQEYMGSKNLCLRLRIKGNPQLYFKDYGKTWALTKEELEK